MCNDVFTLSKAPVGSTVKVCFLLSQGLLRQRLLDLGILPGSKIHVLRKSAWRDPTAYVIKDTCIALREEESDTIYVSYIN